MNSEYSLKQQKKKADTYKNNEVESRKEPTEMMVILM